MAKSSGFPKSRSRCARHYLCHLPRSRAVLATLAACTSISATALPAFAGEPAWWTAQKARCGVAMDYNSWVAAGSPCNAGAASGGGASSGSAMANALAPAAGELGYEMGTALGKWIFGDPQKAAQEAAAQAAVVEQEQAARQQAAASQQRLLTELKMSDSAGGLSLKSSGAPSGLRLKRSSDTTSALASNSAHGQLLNSLKESNGQLFENRRDAASPDATLPVVATPPASAPLAPRLAANKEYRTAAMELAKTQKAADALNKQLSDLQTQQDVSSTPARQIDIYKLTGQVNQANGAVKIAAGNLDDVKHKILQEGPAIVVTDRAPAGNQSLPPPGPN